MVAKRDRTGEEGYNSFGSRMVIIRYKNNAEIDVLFPKYNYVVKNNNYSNFKIGGITCPYEPREYNIGYLGEGKYKKSKNGKMTKCYSTWHNMLMRCYDKDFQEKNSTYKGCKVCDEWLNFQNFAEWYYKNYYEIEGKIMNLDKDILIKGNKIYSPKTCIFVPNDINVLFVKKNKSRGKDPIGVHEHKRDNIYEVNCNNCDGKQIYLGRFKTKIEAFKIYKSFKENIIKKTIDKYENIIPEPYYSRLKTAMYNYKVEITD